MAWLDRLMVGSPAAVARRRAALAADAPHPSADEAFDEILSGTPPHCDQAVLHAPGECGFCDAHPDWQALRRLWGIAFTGHKPAWVLPHWREVACPSDARRGTGMSDVWAGNRPTDHPPRAPESRASQVMYGGPYDGEHLNPPPL